MRTLDPSVEHEVPAGFEWQDPPPPLEPADPAPERSVAEHARTLVANSTVGSLATLSEDGSPWASLVTYGLLDDGSPVLLLSTLAEHGRNAHRDPRASLVVSEGWTDREPLAHGRVTLQGRLEIPQGETAERARAAHLKAVPSAASYVDFGDFDLWVLRVQRVRWVGGYGRMDSAPADAYLAAEPDPTAPAAQHAIDHLNEDHADALLAIARALGGYSDATSARCSAIDRYGIELKVRTPRGPAATVRVGFAEPVNDADGLREATVELTRRARAKDGA
jgi:hypothetical protein